MLRRSSWRYLGSKRFLCDTNFRNLDFIPGDEGGIEGTDMEAFLASFDDEVDSGGDELGDEDGDRAALLEVLGAQGFVSLLEDGLVVQVFGGEGALVDGIGLIQPSGIELEHG